MAGQARAVAAGSLDRPGPQARLLVRELNQRLVARGSRLDGHLGQHPAGPGMNCRGAMGCHMSINADHHVDDLRETIHALLLLPGGT